MKQLTDKLTPEQLLDEYLDEMSPVRLEPIEIEGFIYISLDDFREYIINRELTANTAEDELIRDNEWMWENIGREQEG